MVTCDFHGWVTKNNLKCSDGRTIMKDAFKHNDGREVPLVWNHQHDEMANVLGHVLLENRDEGVYGYGIFNDSENGQLAKVLVQHGDISALSIYANQLKQNGGNVMHGEIREVSLVHAGANPGARIVSVIQHSDSGDEEVINDEAYICTGDNISLYHSSDSKKEEVKEEKTVAEDAKTTDTKETEETVGDVWKRIENKLDEDEMNVVYAMIGQAIDEGSGENDEDDSEGGNENMKHNVFENDNETAKETFLSHADQAEILALAKSPAVGSFREAMKIYASQHSDTLAHGTWENIGELFPDFKDVHPGAPELLERDYTWVASVIKKAHKSPISRVRTRQADGRATSLRAKGYNDREIEKKIGGNLKLYMRTTEPTTVYVKDALHRDDINDITEFDVVAYQKHVMKSNMEETIALAALVGDLREDTDPDKIDEEKIRPIWKDDELYTIHYDIDLEKAANELQGSNTSAYFGENYIRAEALVAASLYASEKYKGKGAKTMFIDPHELNVMLLARDMNGRRIYDSKADLAKAFNVDEIQTVEQFNGLTRTTKDGKTKKLLCLIVNMANYQFGCTKGGEITSFDDFDIDFNQYKYLMETRVSGALTEVFSAIAIEEDVTDEA